MSSIRQDILTTLTSQLVRITAANGYNNTLSSTRLTKGFVSLNQVNEFPYCFYGLGGEKLTDTDESGNILFQDVEGFIGVWFQCNAGAGNITDEMEKWIDDLKRFTNQDPAIGRTKALDFLSTKGIKDCKVKSISPYIDYDKNIGSLFIEFTINYIEGL